MAADGIRELYEQLIAGGWQRIEEMISSASDREDSYLDFKECKIGGKPSTEPDLKVFAKAASAFANTSGGVLVWGIEAKDNKPRALSPTPDAAKFAQNLSDHSHQVLDPSLAGIESHPIPKEDGSGYAVTYIPSSPRKPHAAAQGDKTFWQRIDSSCAYMPAEIVRAVMMANAVPSLKLVAYDLTFSEATLTYKRNRYGLYEDDDEVDGWRATLNLALFNDGDAVAEVVGVTLPLFDSEEDVKGWFTYQGDQEDLHVYEHSDDTAGRASKLCRLEPQHVMYPRTRIDVAVLNFEVIRPDCGPMANGIEIPYDVYARGVAQHKTLRIAGKALKERFDEYQNKRWR